MKNQREDMESHNTETICYCFGYTRQDILEDIEKNMGRSTVMERIMAEKKRGSCRCKEQNPRGR